MTDHVSNLLFCPTGVSVNNLRREGIINGVHEVGDTMTEVLLTLDQRLKDEPIQKLGLVKGGYVLCTIHRRRTPTIGRT